LGPFHEIGMDVLIRREEADALDQFYELSEDENEVLFVSSVERVRQEISSQAQAIAEAVGELIEYQGESCMVKLDDKDEAPGFLIQRHIPLMNMNGDSRVHEQNICGTKSGAITQLYAEFCEYDYRGDELIGVMRIFVHIDDHDPGDSNVTVYVSRNNSPQSSDEYISISKSEEFDDCTVSIESSFLDTPTLPGVLLYSYREEDEGIVSHLESIDELLYAVGHPIIEEQVRMYELDFGEEY